SAPAPSRTEPSIVCSDGDGVWWTISRRGTGSSLARSAGMCWTLHVVVRGPVRYACSGDLRLAYQELGSGPDVVLAVPPLAQNIEIAWERPEMARMLERFGSFCRYIHFDKRGTGASDRTAELADLDDRVDDMVAVLDAAGVEAAHL